MTKSLHDRLTLRFAGAAAALAVGSVQAFAQDIGDARRGLGYAQEHCAGCHAVHAEDRISPAAGVATFKVIANSPGMSAMALSVWLQTPHRDMPNLIVPPQDRDNVVAYIVSLKDPPTSK